MKINKCKCSKCDFEYEEFWDCCEDRQDVWETDGLVIVYRMKCESCGHEYLYVEEYPLASACVEEY